MSEREPCGCPPDTLSISQVEAHSTCKRKRAWDKIDRVPRGPGTEAAERGQRAHDTIEKAIHNIRDRYKGAPPDLTTDEGQIALSGAHHWPRDWMSTETHFSVHLGPHRFHGYYDLITPRAIWDWKTTGDLVWAKDEYQLRVNPQVCLYAYARMVNEGLKSVDIRWLYMRSRKPWRCLPPSEISLTLEEIKPTIDWIIGQADEIRVIERSGIRTALQLAPTVTACSAFGGCQFQNLCNLTENERMTGIFMGNSSPQDMAAALDKMLLGMPTATASAAPAAPTLPPGVKTPEQMGWPAAPVGMVYHYDPANPQNAAAGGWGYKAAATAAPPAPPTAPTFAPPAPPPAPPTGFNPPPVAFSPPDVAPLASLLREAPSTNGASAAPVAAPKRRGRPPKANGAPSSAPSLPYEGGFPWAAWDALGVWLESLGPSGD